jgi:hypothetical protein
MRRATLVCAALVLGALATVRSQDAPRPDGWVVISVDDYRALRLSAYPPDRPPEPPPVEATITRVEYDLRASGESITGEARLTIDVLQEGWIRIEVPPGLLVRASRIDGRPVSIVNLPSDPASGPAGRGSPHVLLSRPGRSVLSLDIVVPLKMTGETEMLTLPASRGAVSRLALVVARPGIDLSVTGGVLAERAQEPEGRWVAYGRAGQPMTVTWKKRTADTRVTQPLKWRGSVTQLVGLGEDTSSVTATVHLEIVQGQASSLDVAIADGLVINQVERRPHSTSPERHAWRATDPCRCHSCACPARSVRPAASPSKCSAPVKSGRVSLAGSTQPIPPTWAIRSPGGSHRRWSRSGSGRRKAVRRGHLR